MSRSSERALLVRDLQTLLDAQRKARELLQTVERLTRKTIRHIEDDATIEELLASFVDPAETATDLTAALELVEAARLQARCRIVRLAQAEGISLTKLAAFWGISRQRVSRYAQARR